MRTAKSKPFKSEVELCARFLGALKRDEWEPYAETAGWDILLVRRQDGFQIGIQAKLRLNCEVIAQTIEDGRSYSADRSGPDCRAVLVPNDKASGFDTISGYVGFTIIRVYAEGARGFGNSAFYPYLPSLKDMWDRGHWFECCPAKRHKLPEYVPDVDAGSPSPIQLTEWKISAIKVAITLERRGYVPRSDFKTFQIDYRRWIAAESGWLKVSDGRYLPGPRMPDFKGQHPRVYAEIAADSDRWMPKGLLQGPGQGLML